MRSPIGGAPVLDGVGRGLAARLRRRSWPLAVTVVSLVTGMAYCLLWGPLVRHTQSWIVPWDIWGAYRSAHFVGWGDLGNVYSAGTGLVTAVSGMLTKQGVSVWSSRPPAAGYRSADVSERVGVVAPAMAMGAAGSGPATVATYTVIHVDGRPTQGVLIADRSDGTRAIAITGESSVVQAMATEEWCGRSVDLDAVGGFKPR